MLKSSNLNSILDTLEASATAATNSGADTQINYLNTSFENAQLEVKTPVESATTSLATQQLSAGVLEIFQPPLVKARTQLKELIGKQNKIYIDLSAEKFKWDNAEMAKLHEMMNNVKVYREKLLKIKKQMQSIYQRTKVMKKRAANIQACKVKELQRKLQKQQHEESLIGKQ